MADTLRSFAEVSLLPVTTPGGSVAPRGRLSFAGWGGAVCIIHYHFFSSIFCLFYLTMAAIWMGLCLNRFFIMRGYKWQVYSASNRRRLEIPKIHTATPLPSQRRPIKSMPAEWRKKTKIGKLLFDPLTLSSRHAGQRREEVDVPSLGTPRQGLEIKGGHGHVPCLADVVSETIRVSEVQWPGPSASASPFSGGWPL